MEYFDQQGLIADRLPPTRRGAALEPDTRHDPAFAALIVPFREGWAIQPYQPQHLTPEKRAGAVMRGDDGTQNIFRANLTPDIWAAAWAVQPPQPRAPAMLPARLAAALMRGDDGNQGIFLPPWTMATPRSTFPNVQSDVRAAIPSYNAGPQVGSISSMPNITTPVLLKATPGTLFAITVVAPGTAAGGFYDCNAVAAAGTSTQVAPIPTTGGPLFLFEWPCQYGIVVIPGAGQVLAAKWA